MPYLQADAKQLEWRAAIELSQDETGLIEIKQQHDAHALNQVAFELPSRLIAKKYLFRTIFRGSGWAFANDNEFMHVSSDPKFWDKINEKFYKKYHGLDKQHKQWCELVLSGRPIVGPLGREWLIPLKHITGKEFKIPWTLLSNYPVQGTGADIMAIARVSAYNRIQRSGLECKFVSTVHDSIVLDTPTKNLQPLANIFYEVFDDLQLNIKRMFKYDWQTPLECECKSGPNMKDQTELSRT